MTFLPIPTVTLDGQPVHCEAEGGRLGDEVTIMAPLQIRWGRTSPWEQPAPATMTFTLWDPHGVWAARLRDRTALAVPVTASWSEAGSSLTFFQGHTVAAQAERSNHRTEAGEYGWWIALTVADRAAWLGLVGAHALIMPQEWLYARLAKMQTDLALTGAGIAAIAMPADYLPLRCGPGDVAGSAFMDVLTAAYQSFGAVWAYHPGKNRIVPVTRTSIGTAQLRGYLMTQGHGRTLYIVAGGLPDPVAGEPPHSSVAVDGCTTTFDGAITFDLANQINRVDATFPDAMNAHEDSTTTMSGVVTGSPTRLLTFDCWFDSQEHVSNVVEEVYRRAVGETTRPQHPTIVVDTRRAGGFLTARQAAALTLPTETPAPVWVTGSQFARWAGPWAPAFTRAGGTITFDGEHWQIETSLAPIGGELVAAPATWASIDTAITWADSPGYQLDNSITWWDTRHLLDGTIYSEDS